MEQQDKGVKAEERKGHTGVFNLEVEAPSQLFLALRRAYCRALSIKNSNKVVR